MEMRLRVDIRYSLIYIEKKYIANSNDLAYNKSNRRSLRFVGFVNGGSFVSRVRLHRIGAS